MDTQIAMVGNEQFQTVDAGWRGHRNALSSGGGMTQWYLNHGIRAVVSIRPTNPKLLLIEVAERQFAVAGFAGTTVRSIAGLAGVRDHVVYNLFGSKAGLLRAVDLARSREEARRPLLPGPVASLTTPVSDSMESPGLKVKP